LGVFSQFVRARTGDSRRPGWFQLSVSASGRLSSVQSFGCLTAARSPIVVIDGALIHQFPYCAETSFSSNQDLFKLTESLQLFYVLFNVRFEPAFLFEMNDGRGGHRSLSTGP
jgi:hypothetical protein